MITAFTVQNFKAIGDEPVRIELKPITLLFGANSAGKSSILHALNYAYSVFKDYNLNAEYNTHSDSSFNLGGFSRFVHGNDLKRSIVLCFELDFKAENDISLLYLDDYDHPFIGSPYDSIPMLKPKELLAKVETAYVKATIYWDDDQNRPYVSHYETGLDGEWIARIKAEGYKKKTSVCGFNVAHPVFKDIWVDYGILMDWLITTCLKKYKSDVQGNKSKTPEERLHDFESSGRIPISDSVLLDNMVVNLADQNDALPDLRFRLFNFDFVHWSSIDEDINVGGMYYEKERTIDLPYNREYEELLESYNPFKEHEKLSDNIDIIRKIKKLIKKPHQSSLLALEVVFKDLLSSVLLAPRLKVTKWLESICYLGPLREIPSRYFTGDSLNNNEMIRLRWEKGLTAWDLLYWIGQQGSDTQAKSRLPNINDWLVDDQRLNTGYRIEIERYREVPSELLDEAASQITEIIRLLPEKIRIWLKDKRGLKLTPHEIGVGISQVLPVVVAAVGANAQLVAIEQPELHIHPALQVQLGDLFIEQSKDRKKFFLIETHSEHLLLRLLRRIRESAEEQTPDEVKLSPNNVAIYYVESENGSTQVNRIGLDESGRFTDRWPRGFLKNVRKNTSENRKIFLMKYGGYLGNYLRICCLTPVIQKPCKS
ncbi:MAG: DUF3696 domain-containing protein [Synechococcaceae cyanobacterium SM1_2_3]|nr:DUF3696 domain-containing protein [Synechococcaceae cyanobacterium SM1_2_3]